MNQRSTFFLTILCFVLIEVLKPEISAADILVIPKAPVSLTATANSATQVTLTWQDAATDETGFELERSLDNKTYTKLIDLPANTKTYINTGLTASTSYWYRIRAKNASGFSAYSNIVSATTLQVAPAAPGELAGIAVSTTQINLTWTDNANNETGFQLERSLDGVAFLKIADLAANVTTFQNTGLTTFTEYFYRVRAVNAVGASAYSNVVALKTQNIPAPDRPLNLTAVPTEPELIQVRWSAVTGGATETVIERSKDNDANFVQIGKVAANVLQFEDRGKLETADYYYRIKAINAGGSSPYSTISIVRASTIITGTEPMKSGDLVFVAGKTLVTELKNQSPGTLSVYGVGGNQYLKIGLTPSSRTDLSALPAGIYIVVIEMSQKVISRKVLLY